MARETTVKGRLGRLVRLAAPLAANREELQHLEVSRTRFEAQLTQLQESADRQAAHTAGKQEASQQVNTLLVEAERLATVLQLAVKQHFGIRSEKLAEFGLKPFRGRARKTTTEEPQPATPEQPAPAKPEAA